MKLLMAAVLMLNLSTAIAYDDEEYSDFNPETARDVLEGGEASDEFLAAKERLQMSEDRANLSDEEAAMLMLSNSEIN